MADKAENNNQSAPAGGERRAALRSDESGGSSTRLRESNFPMRKASTLPDISAYNTSGETTSNDSSTGSDSVDPQRGKPGQSEHSVVEDEAVEGARHPASVSAGKPAPAGSDTPAPAGSDTPAPAGSDTPAPAGSDTPGTVVSDTSAEANQEANQEANPEDSSAAQSPESTSTDPASPKTEQVAATPARRKTDDDAAPDTSALTIRPSEEDVNRRASQRDEAAAAKPVLPRVLQIAVAVFFPVILLAAAVRAVTTPLFLWVEYHRPGFPADSYGFSTEDRMTYGSYAMDYILNWAPARYLGELVNADSDQLFLDSEVGHMADVKSVLSTGFVVATVLTLLAIAACAYLARRYPGGIRRALFAGAVATLVLAIALAVIGIVAWEAFFTQVHALFFADGTWTFRLDDTLIRLFPAQFWIDAAATVGAIVLIGAVLTLVFTWPTKARRDKSAHAYAARRVNRGV